MPIRLILSIMLNKYIKYNKDYITFIAYYS